MPGAAVLLAASGFAVLLGSHALERDVQTKTAGSEFVEISSRHMTVQHFSPDTDGRLPEAARSSMAGRYFRREPVLTHRRSQEAGVSMELDASASATRQGETSRFRQVAPHEASSAAAQAAAPAAAADLPRAAGDVKWGSYRFQYLPFTDECVEAGVNTWEGKSLFEVWSGTDAGLTITDGATVNQGVIKETPKGLRIYKAACPNATTVKVGGTMEIPVGTMSVDLVFGITRKCTGDCAPFMVSVLDATTDAVKHRWCWNREGNAPDVLCDEVKYVPAEKWNKASLNISNYTDFVSPIKLELAVYTSGDFRFLPTLPGEVGLGGRAMTLIDSLIFGPSERPLPDSSFSNNCMFCRQSMRQTCKENSWCLDKYRCYAGWCTEGKARCNEIRNCPDDSDEVGCEYKMGFRGEFYLNHVRYLHSGSANIDDLRNPDVRRLHELIEYDATDWWEKFHVRENFAARFVGNFSITGGGHYYFDFPSSGDTKLRITGMGSNSDKDFNVTSDSWINMPAGKYQVKLDYIHLGGQPSLVLKYAGIDTRGQKKTLARELVSATMTGSRCDTMMCPVGNALAQKPDIEKLLCDTVPCKEQVDTRTCCSRQYKVIACGDHSTCALDVLGRPVCWGSWPGYNEQWKQHPGPFIDISTRGKYICAVLQETHMIDCWQPDNVSTPSIDYSPDGMFSNVSVGGDHSCALRDTGFAACTGANTEKQVDAPSNKEFMRVSAGESFTCGITALDRGVMCWGANERGQSTPPSGRGHNAYSHISSGKYHACGISNGTAHCWGWNNDAQATAPAGQDFTTVAAGGMHTCALKANGQAQCWGANGQGQAEPVTSDAPFSAISSGHKHSCAIRAADKEVVCWGSNFEEADDGSMTWRGQSAPPPAGLWP